MFQSRQDSRSERALEVRALYAAGAAEPRNYEIICAGLSLVSHHNVFPPKYFSDSEWFALEIAPLASGKSLLDMGTGTGIIGLRAAVTDSTLNIPIPARVTSIDLNPDAVETAKLNYERNGIRARVLCGDMYSPLGRKDKFQLIFWNHPFNKGENSNEPMLLRAGFDYQYQSLQKYIEGAKQHLTDDGRLLLGTGNLAPLIEIESMANAHGYEFNEIRRTVCPMGPTSQKPNDFRIYELKA